MIALHTKRMPGKGLRTWKWGPLFDERDINRILARRFSYGSYRPSDRAALLVDASPMLTPYADEPLEVVAAD